ncbi:Aste57867_3328 [Aphanomyces stellatus]|uniref:Aste57867_3328 protein n=1 Tax=Aphanomyces stellatus TaxID=120398 RepID=A0A485KBV9_9STRA|nr:hypothetical protein As57867_003318 [Aphanomyces stellatus]VFT80498.1 Aste57867_3328 [Aphanomyces stellatus]
MLPPLIVLSILASTVAASAHLNIVHGTEAAVGVAPYVVSVRLDNAAASTTCSRVLVAPRFVLTAAHCVFDGSKQYASIGSHFGNGTTDGERISVQLATRHPRYNITSKDFDFAVLELTYRPRIVHAQPIAISWDVYPPGTLAMHRGFGMVNYTTYLSAPADADPTGCRLQRPDHDQTHGQHAVHDRRQVLPRRLGRPPHGPRRYRPRQVDWDLVVGRYEMRIFRRV